MRLNREIMQMKYEGKYKEMAEQFRADGCDEYTIEKFIRQEMEMDEFRKGEGTTELDAYREWMKLPEDARDMFLNNALCINCGVASFAKGYNIRRDKYGIVIEGTCAKCGEKIARVVD